MALKHITFTGIDQNTDLYTLQVIQEKYPLVEFGVLYSYHWKENGNRFPNPNMIKRLHGRRLNLSLHLCGEAAHDASVGNWEIIDSQIDLTLFQRVQLNISTRKNNPEYCHIPLVIGQELIIQQADGNNTDLFDKTVSHWTSAPFPHREPISVLIDPSGGVGKESKLKVLPISNNVGYAGGINADNVTEKLEFLLKKHVIGNFWIDMETGVRTDDWFDINKVYKVLEICQGVINEHNGLMRSESFL